jgi:hypothetical protein
MHRTQVQYVVSCVHVCSLPGRASKAQGGSKCALHSEDSELSSFITGLVGLGGEHLPLLAHVRVSSGDMLAECIATLEVSGALCALHHSSISTTALHTCSVA